ncbi:double zinc ribbon domain-containing protein [Streptomyces sp. NBC_00207]|uniref:double zinc ribbon domain-containing protein n=1 Tax=Streptomyces sp. NBC_00207 TaxID=2903635 RepID=UPI00386577C9
MRCSVCEYENPPGTAYCQRCQGPLTRPCATCGEPVPAGSQICPACGATTGPTPHTAALPPPADPPPFDGGSTPPRSDPRDGTAAEHEMGNPRQAPVERTQARTATPHLTLATRRDGAPAEPSSRHPKEVLVGSTPGW